MHDEIKSLKSGKYTLVARFHKGANRGAIWAGGKIVDEVQGETLKDVWDQLYKRLCALQQEVVAQRRGLDYTSQEVKRAFLAIEPRLSTGHKAMLRAHVKAAGRALTATQLAEAAGYANYSAANLQYGLLGAMLFGEMPEVLPTLADGTPIMTFAIASGDGEHRSGEGHWIWTMRPHIAEGLLGSGIL